MCFFSAHSSLGVAISATEEEALRVFSADEEAALEWLVLEKEREPTKVYISPVRNEGEQEMRK